MKTKRRKVWVNEYPDRGLSDVAFSTKRFAERSSDYEAKAVSFVERLPGDVVLSREEVAEMKAIIMALVSRSDFPAHYDRALALLRGRR